MQGLEFLLHHILHVHQCQYCSVLLVRHQLPLFTQPHRVDIVLREDPHEAVGNQRHYQEWKEEIVLS